MKINFVNSLNEFGTGVNCKQELPVKFCKFTGERCMTFCDSQVSLGLFLILFYFLLFW